MIGNSAVAAVSDRRSRSEIDATIYVAQYSCAQRNLHPPQVQASSQPLKEGRCTPAAEGGQSFFGHLRVPWKTRRISTAWPRTR